MKLFRQLYNWVLKWAESPYGSWALFLLAFAESSFFPVPPDVLLIALAIGKQNRSFRFALYCSFASVLGGIFGYAIGHYLWWEGHHFSILAQFFFDHIPGFSNESFFAVQNQYNNYGFLIIFTAGFTPIPYKIFTITAGAFDIDFMQFIFASVISRSARFFLVAGLIWKYGEPIKAMIDKHFNRLTIIFTVLLIGGFILIKLLI